MKGRLPLALSATALVVSLFGATPLGNATVRVVRSIPPLANKSNYATVAGNAQRLGGHAASASGTPGTIPVLNKVGKLPVSVGAVGPQGPAGPPGPAGAGAQVNLSKLLSSAVDVYATSLTENGSADLESVKCPSSAWEAVSGGAYTTDSTVVTTASWPLNAGSSASDGPPDSDSGPPIGWATKVVTTNGLPAKNVLVRWYVVCVKPGG